jgi:endonuclease/exonuclease/phosphatase family metal-dependent hydrolase
VRSRIADAVVATVMVALVLAAVVVAALLVVQGGPSPRLSAEPAGTTSQSTRRAPAALHRAASSAPVSPSPPTATASRCVAVHQRTRLTVVTFNIHSARAQDGALELDPIARALAAWRPDVVLLQEVDRGRVWSDRVDMPAALADRLHMTWTFGVNVRRSATNEYGTAILSRYPILRAHNVRLPRPPGTQQRGLLHATIDAHGILVSVYGTHLENGSPEARLQQIRTIAPILAADPRPEFLGGDLNTGPTSPVASMARSVLTDTWQAVGVGQGDTVPARAPDARIDYLLYRGGSGVDIRPLRAQVLPRVVSDHRAVRASYRLSTGGAPVCVPVLQDQTQR